MVTGVAPTEAGEIVGNAYMNPPKKKRVLVNKVSKERQPSKTPHTKSWPPPPRPPEAPGWSESRKDYMLHHKRQPSNTRIGPDYGSFVPNWLLCFIDWLNALFGADKSKHKHNAESMMTLAELFDGVEESIPIPPKPDPAITPTTMKGNYPKKYKPRPPRPGQPPGNTSTTPKGE